jgi:hypothetical protein
MNHDVLARAPDLPPWKRRAKRWSATVGAAALCGAAASVGMLDSATAPDAVAGPSPFPATIAPVTETPSDVLLLPYFEESDWNKPPPAEAPPPTQAPPPNGIPFLPPLPTFPLPTFFPFPPPG